MVMHLCGIDARCMTTTDDDVYAAVVDVRRPSPISRSRSRFLISIYVIQ